MNLARRLTFVLPWLLAPWADAQCELAKLRDDDTSSFGQGVALSGDVAWVGGVSKAIAWRHDQGEWLQTLDFPVPFAGDVGDAVATDGSVAVVGVANAGGTPSGRAYVFERHGDTWSHVATLTGAGSTPFDRFGGSVGVSGSTILVSAHQSDTLAPAAGKVHVFERLPAGWTETAQFYPDIVKAGLQFGAALSMQGERALVGAIGDAGGVELAGSAYVFERQAGVWVQTAHLIATQPKFQDAAGRSVALDGDLAVVGCDSRDVVTEDEGAVFVFEHGAGGWQQTAELVAPDGVTNEGFGTSVSTSEDRILVGKPHDYEPGFTEAPTAYVFERSGGPWVATKIFPGDAVPFTNFGRAVALDGDMALIGAPTDAAASPDGGGSVYVVDVDATTVWTDLGSGLAGTAGVPSLVAHGELCAGLEVRVVLSGAAAGAPLGVIFGLGIAGVPFKGGTLVPQPDAFVFGVTSVAGGFDFVATLPKSLPPPLALFAQAWVADAGGPAGFAASNAVSGSVD